MQHKLKVAFCSALVLGVTLLMTGGAGTAAAAQNIQNTTSDNPATSHTYAVLGDSVAAGLGLPSTDAQCGKSTEAYAYQVAEDQNLPLAHIACSGATVGDLFTKQRVEGPNIKPQLDAAFANGTPQLITVTAGANDVHWADFVAKCYTATCGTQTDDHIASAYLAWLELKLEYALYQIERRSHGTPPTVVFTGYYNPISEVCAAFEPRLTTTEIQWLGTQLEALNQTIQDTIEHRSYARFASVDFTGHDICSADPWVQGRQDTAPFHPTAAGQQAIARSVLEVL